MLLVQRSAAMKTCPGALSIVGEHHNGRESDDACAARALREELPGLDLLRSSALLQLRPTPRWFLFDYPVAADGVQRFDRCLVKEYLLLLNVSRSTALAKLRTDQSRQLEHEAARFIFEPLVQVYGRLRRSPQSFCAAELLPSALLNTVADVCGTLRARGVAGAQRGCANVLRWHERVSLAATTMPETMDLSRVVRGRQPQWHVARGPSAGHGRVGGASVWPPSGENIK
jgi:hypothetical protein